MPIEVTLWVTRYVAAATDLQDWSDGSAFILEEMC